MENLSVLAPVVPQRNPLGTEPAATFAAGNQKMEAGTMIAPPLDRHGIELRIGQTVRAVVPWGEIEGALVGMKCRTDVSQWWIWIAVEATYSNATRRTSRMAGEWNEVQVEAEACEITT